MIVVNYMMNYLKKFEEKWKFINNISEKLF